MEIVIIGKPDFAGKIAQAVPSANFVELEERIFPDGEVCPRLLISKAGTRGNGEKCHYCSTAGTGSMQEQLSYHIIVDNLQRQTVYSSQDHLFYAISYLFTAGYRISIRRTFFYSISIVSFGISWFR
jgi:hypothetical protein